MASKWVEIEDHTEDLKAVNEKLRINPERTAIVTIDMHRGHMDPVNATLPAPMEECQKVLSHTGDLLSFARGQGMPVIHVVLTQRTVENERSKYRKRGAVLAKDAPMTDARRQGIPHNIVGSIQTELMPELGVEDSDHLIDTKKTLSAFMGTDLDNLLRLLDVETTILVGINTNSCVQCSSFEARNLGYNAVVIEECVASMYGQDLHVFGLQNIARNIGWVLTAEQFKHKVFQYLEEGA
jgi:nicotinamidase-related amidase